MNIKLESEWALLSCQMPPGGNFISHSVVMPFPQTKWSHSRWGGVSAGFVSPPTDKALKPSDDFARPPESSL